MIFSLSRRAVTLSAAFAVTAAAASSAGLLWTTSCQQQPVNVPVVTFERAQKMDVVCMHVLVPDANSASGVTQVPPTGVPLANCAPVAADVTGAYLPYHLFALVTQTARGELAAVDLTAGHVVDEDIATPGINFVPVGALPTDVAVTSDGQMAFVTSAEVNKPALYGIPTSQLLGNSQGLAPQQTPPAPRLTSWPVCALEQAPIAVSVVPRRTTPTGAAAGDAGAGDAGAGDAGTTTTGSDVPYDVVVVLPGVGDQPGRVLLIDPVPFLKGADVLLPDGGEHTGSAIGRGELAPCTGVALNLGAALPDVVAAGARWDDGVKYIDGGVDLADANPSSGTVCTASDGDAGPSAVALAVNRGVQPRAAETARDEQTLYVADSALPLIHVIDLSTPGTMRELAPLVATSVADPDRPVSVGAIAVSPLTRDYKKFVYAVDKRDGNVMVFDVTQASTQPRFPLTRPHAELNPFQPVDRINFGSPVATLAFVKHDWPIDRQITDANGAVVERSATSTGLLCNPNPNAGADYNQPYRDPGANYRANAITASSIISLGPARLRGVFAFATLSSGQVITIDVDDWDAPCRRPDPMNDVTPTSAIAPGQPTAQSLDDLDPYHAPQAYASTFGDSTPVSLEAFFPASAPHRPRSLYLLRRDPTLGSHVPTLAGSPLLTTVTQTLATTGPDSTNNPLLLPTRTPFADYTYVPQPWLTDPGTRKVLPETLNGFAAPVSTNFPAVRFAWEDPTVHFDQDWSVSYEGALPGFDGVRTIVTSRDDNQTLELVSPEGLFCRRGVEDYRLGTARVQAAIAAAAASNGTNITFPARVDRHTADYVQITSEVLPVGDPYWAQETTTSDDTGASSCWSEALSTPDARQAACFATYGNAADQSFERDFPILEAYESRLVIGRFGIPDGAVGANPTSREIVGKDPSNKPFLRAMRCCFNKQVAFRVRTGGEWVGVASSLGYLHHIVADATPERACVQSCKSSEALLNARAIEVPRPADPTKVVAPDRNSPLALRNPMFSYVIWAGGAPKPPEKTTTQRDYTWHFSTRGQFLPLSVNLAANTTAVSPQSMRFIDTLGKLAVVDGNSQGLVLIDLNSVTAGSPYY